MRYLLRIFLLPAYIRSNSITVWALFIAMFIIKRLKTLHNIF